MNIKASVAVAVLAMSTIWVSACASSSSSTAPQSSGPAGSASTTASSPATAPSATDPAASVSSSNSAGAPTRSGSSGGSGGGSAVRTDIPNTAMLAQSDLAAAPSGSWQQFDGATVPGIQEIDPDNCDPTPRPQSLDARYPHNPAWVNARTLGWSSANSTAQVSEAVITYTSAAAASADYTKHQGWVANCASRFQWTDAPMTFAISPAQLSGVSGGYAVRVAMDPAGRAASTPGSQGVDYMAVILRGNTLTVLNVSDTGAPEQNPKDPGLGALQHTAQAAASKLSAVYTSAR